MKKIINKIVNQELNQEELAQVSGGFPYINLHPCRRYLPVPPEDKPEEGGASGTW